MLTFNPRFKKSYSCLWSIPFLLLLSACSSGDSTLTTQTENKDGVSIPSVVSEALPDDGTLSAYIRVDDGPRQAMTINDGMASITLNGLTLGEHTITMEFEFVLDSNPDQPLLLASASRTMNVGSGQNPILTFTDYTTDGEGFDADNDGISNLAELSNYTDPFVAGPVATDVRITANAPLITGTVLTGNYTFNDPNSGTEGDSTYQWLRDDMPIVGATSPTYTLTDTDIGSKIRFKVVPVTLTDSIRGTAAISPPAVNINRIGETGIGLPRATVIKGDYAYVAASGILSIIDISNPANPLQVGYYDTPGFVQNLTIVQNYIYLVDTNGMIILDISVPTAPTKVAAFETGGPKDLVVSGNYAYVADLSDGLRIINISDPIAPSETTLVGAAGYVYDVAISGKYAYVADQDYGLRIFDVSNPYDPSPSTQTEVGSFQTPGNARSVAVSGSYAFVACGDGGLSIIKISNPNALEPGGIIDIPTPESYFEDVVTDGNYAYILDSAINTTILIYDISNPEAPVKLGEFVAPGNFGSEAITINGHYAYMADRDYGLRIIDISEKAAPTEVGALNATGFSYNIAVNGNYAYMVKLWDGLGIFDISDPTAPVEVGTISTPGDAFGVTVDGDFAYVADRQNGLRIINISEPTAPLNKGAVITSGFAYDVAISGGYAFVAGDTAGLIVVDVRQPDVPGEVTSLDTGGSATSVVISGNQAFVADEVGGLHIIDISAPTTPTKAGFLDTISATDVAVSGSYAYVVGGNSLYIINITNPQALTVFGSLNLPDYAIALSIAISGNYAYVADELGGLRVIDISVPDAPVEVGEFYTLGKAYGVALSGNYAYVADDGFGLGVYEYVAP
jgi:hypothetical protein